MIGHWQLGRHGILVWSALLAVGILALLALPALTSTTDAPESASGEATSEQADQARQARKDAQAKQAAYEQHIAALKERVPKGFTVVASPPFAVVGDEPADVVANRARLTVAWAVAMLKKDFFARDPEKTLDIWLFKDKESYEKHTKEIFGDTPTTPYGYYSSRHGALVMNIATGGGTLVHEIVHPFMAANFPDCPAWFNEGIGSLYEQSGERDGHIVGFTNWRLPGLQDAIRADKTLSFEKLTALDDDAFYGDGAGLHYAQARYLCYYLQERGLLRKYYAQFVADCEEDPTGYATLCEVLGNPDMATFERDWRAYVLKLRFKR